MIHLKTKVVLDTNILLMPGTRAVDVFSLLDRVIKEPYRLATYEIVVAEVQKLIKGSSKESFAAKLGFILIKQKGLKILRSSLEGHVDDVIVEKSRPNQDIVVTQDLNLIKRLRARQVRVLRYQQKKFVFQL